MKKIISITLSLLMLTGSVSAVPITANATSITSSVSSEYSSGDFSYTISNSSEATITGYTGTDEIVVIPETIDGYTVTEIGANAFYGSTTIKELEIAKTITKIGQTAFAECTSLTKVFIPKSLKTLDTKCITDEPWWRYTPYDAYYGPFYNCTNLTDVTFEEGIESIPAYLFGNSNVGITEIHIPNTVKTINKCAFTACKQLKTLTLSNNLESIKWNAFTACTALEGLTIPKSLKSIEIDDAFGSRNGPFTACSSLGEVSFEEGTTTVIQSLFCGATGITSITFPESMETISDSAFESCTNLTSVKIKSGIKSIGNHAFRDCSKLKSVDIPSSVKTIGSYCFYLCSALETVTMANNSIGAINYCTFGSCASLKKITIPNGVYNIFVGAFLGTALDEIVIPKSVTNMAIESFTTVGTIYGCAGSYAETFSKYYKIPFVDITKPLEGLCLDQSICESKDYVVMNKGEKLEIKLELYPIDTTDYVILTSSNKIVSISGMYITAKESGDTVITATSSNGLTYSFNLHINGEKTVKDMKITKLPDKLEYKRYEQFDKTGLEVKLYFTDGSSEVTTDYIVGGYNTGIIGEQTITVRYDSTDGTIFRKTFTINIYDPRGELTEISVKQLPNKTNYVKYESLDTTGLIVIGHYESGATEEIKDYTVSGYNSLKLGEQTITVTKGEFTTTFKITLTEKSTLIGDVNSDGIVNIVDATNIQKYLVDLLEFTDNQKSLADVNNDGIVSITDSTQIQKYLAGITTELG